MRRPGKPARTLRRVGVAAAVAALALAGAPGAVTGQSGAAVGAAAQAGAPPSAARMARPAEQKAEEGGLRVIGHADFHWRLRTLDGQSVSLADFRGQVLVVNVWATWCAPCVQELASFARLRKALGDTPVRLLLVSPEDPDHVHRFLRRHRYDLPVLVEERPMPPAFDLRAVPTTYVIDADGRIVLQHRGAAEWDAEPVRLFLERLAAASRGP